MRISFVETLPSLLSDNFILRSIEFPECNQGNDGTSDIRPLDSDL